MFYGVEVQSLLDGRTLSAVLLTGADAPDGEPAIVIAHETLRELRNELLVHVPPVAGRSACKAAIDAGYYVGRQPAAAAEEA